MTKNLSFRLMNRPAHSPNNVQNLLMELISNLRFYTPFCCLYIWDKVSSRAIRILLALFFFELLSAHIRFSLHFCITAAQVVKGHLQRLRGTVLFAEGVKEVSRIRNGSTLILVITGYLPWTSNVRIHILTSFIKQSAPLARSDLLNLHKFYVVSQGPLTFNEKLYFITLIAQ